MRFWARAFATRGAAGVPVMLAGRPIRVADGDAAELEHVLAVNGIVATFESVSATIEERMLVLARQADGVSTPARHRGPPL